MAYNPTTWTTGDVITADKLNNIEFGVTNASSIAVLPETLTNLAAIESKYPNPLSKDKIFDLIKERLKN